MATDISEGTVIDGKYRIERRLAEGGMGIVYVAEHELLKKPVALKVLHAEMSASADAVERFTVEARAASRIEHDNVVRVSDFGRTGDGMFYLVMELLAGHTLADELAQKRRLPLSRALFVATRILRGLEAAHARGVIHRDLKPENVFISPRPDGDDAVKLLDFGIARMRAGANDEVRLTKDGTIMGTPHYMAPEQLRGSIDIDARADVYAVGVMLYEMLAGEPPFPGETFAAIAHAALVAGPRPLDSPLAAVVQQAMAPRREDRFPSATALRQALEQRSEPASVAATAYANARPSQLADIDRVSDTVEDLSGEAQPFPQSHRQPMSRAVPPPRPVADDERPLELDRPAPAPVAEAPANSGRNRFAPLVLAGAVAVAIALVLVGRGVIVRLLPLPAPDVVTIVVADLPRGASVFFDGAQVRPTFTLAGDRAQHRLRLSAPGYADKGILFVPDANQTIDGRMTKSR